MPLTHEALQQAYIEACEAELLAFKPGNVSIYSTGNYLTVEDFRESAKASAPPLCDPALNLGERIFRAIAATHEAVGRNTNLGIVLLAAPMIQACINGTKGMELRENLRYVLDHTTREDAYWAFRAIHLAAPGGLGESEEQNVQSEPTVTLLEAMKIAERRDRIAWQYTNYYTDVFDLAIPRYHSRLHLWDDEQWVTVGVFTGLLRAFPDSHIERNFGDQFSEMVADRMALVEKVMNLFESPEQVMRVLREVDGELKTAGINPGTTADLTVACLLAVRLERLLKAG